ncbi:MAG: N-formylglutamate amidohydrolase [Pseudomonadota bacterium]
MPLERIEGVLEVHDPDVGHVPLVFDSPHSGTDYPPDSKVVAPQAALDSGVDLYVHELFGTAPSHGAALLHALFPRMYIDPNRAADDIDITLIDGVWPSPVNPTEKSERGFGLLRRLVLPDVPLYGGPLPVAEVQMRLDRYYRTYHDTLVRLLDQRLDWFGAVWHVNCHSMKPVGNAMNDDAGVKRPDMVLGDRMGTSCDRTFAAFVAERLESEGLTVKFNDPYQGAELTHAYSDPVAGRHSLQIEINRGLYMNDQTLERTAGFGALAAALDRLIGSLAAYALDEAGRL